MKRIGTFFLAFLFLLASSWIPISAHYCGDTLANVSLFSSSSCCCDADAIQDSCCRDLVQSVVIKDNFVKANQSSVDLTKWTSRLGSAFSEVHLTPHSVPNGLSLFFKPPLSSEPDFTDLLCCFRI